METEEAFPIDENVDVVGEKEHQISKKKNGKFMAAAMGGNAKKRLVQSFVSPRKKAMAKQGSKVGDKGPVPTKKALIKPKPDQDRYLALLSLMMSEIWNKRVGSSSYYIGLVGMIEVYMEGFFRFPSEAGKYIALWLSRFGLIVHVDVKDVSVPGEIALSLWELVELDVQRREEDVLVIVWRNMWQPASAQAAHLSLKRRKLQAAEANSLRPACDF
ncbi:hypothetical protein YC2023_071559 [Brassica napus]